MTNKFVSSKITKNTISRKYLRWRGFLTNLLPCYDVGIFLVGFSSLPIALSLAEIQPSQEIYFLYSSGPDGTRDTCYDIADRMQAMLNGQNGFATLIKRVEEIALDIQEDNELGYGLEVVNPSDPVETFKRIKEVINKVGDKRIALDLTGGKKTMIGGGFTAGSILDFADSIKDAGCDMFYIDSLKYDSRRGSPTPGTEFLTRLDNPYNVYNVQSVQQAEKLFEKHNYEAAADLWEAVEKKLTTPVRGSKSPAEQYGLKDEQKMVQSNLAMANCYKLWDAFDYKRAKKYKSFSFYDPDAERKFTESWGYSDRHVRDPIDVLYILSGLDNRKATFEKKSRVIHLAVDRYQSTIRRKKSGKLDDAISRFVQTLEIICPYLLYQIAQTGGLFARDSGACLNGRIDPDNVEWNITSLIKFLFGKDDYYFHGNGAYQIKTPGEHLKETEYDKVGRIIKLIKFRNDRVHVNKFADQDTIEKNTNALQKLAEKFLRNLSGRYICEQCLEFEELLELHQFRSASLSIVEQLVEELNLLSDTDVNQERVNQIYNEKLHSLEGDAQSQIAHALKSYWQSINKWEGGSDKQRIKVMKVKVILEKS